MCGQENMVILNLIWFYEHRINSKNVICRHTKKKESKEGDYLVSAEFLNALVNNNQRDKGLQILRLERNSCHFFYLLDN